MPRHILRIRPDAGGDRQSSDRLWRLWQLQISSAKRRYNLRLRHLMKSSECPPHLTFETWRRSLEASLLPKIKVRRNRAKYEPLEVGDSVVVQRTTTASNVQMGANNWAKRKRLDRLYVARKMASGIRIWRVK